MYAILLTFCGFTAQAFLEWDSITEDADNYCCKQITDRQDCIDKNDQYDCKWVNRKRGDALDKQIVKRYGNCLSKRLYKCKRDSNDVDATCGNGGSTTRPTCAFDDDTVLMDLNVDIGQVDDSDDVFADTHNYCCKGYDDRKACKDSNDGYECYWLKRNDNDERAIIRKYGERCLGQRFVRCKLRDGIDYQCFSGDNDEGSPTCVYDIDGEDEAIFANINVGQGVSGAIFNYKVLAAAALVIMLLCACAYTVSYKRSDKHLLKDLFVAEYGSTSQGIEA